MAIGPVNVAGVGKNELNNLIDQHNKDANAHKDTLLKRLNDLDARLAKMELLYGTDVTGNPFSVTFVTLDTANVTGIWNEAQARVEF